MKPTITWIVVADGDQAKIFEHDGPGKGLKAVKDMQFDQAHLKASDINTDRPGRTGNAGAPGSRSAIDGSDPVQQRERKFVVRLAEILDEQHTAGNFQRLIIAAAPTALGDIRPALTAGVKSTIIAELPKDLTNLPTIKLAEHFDGLVAV